MNKYIRLYNTVKYLKIKQIYFRVFYFARTRFRKLSGFEYASEYNLNTESLILLDSINSYDSYENKEFTFLNLTKIFDDKIDWNYSKFGKLWT